MPEASHILYIPDNLMTKFLGITSDYARIT